MDSILQELSTGPVVIVHKGWQTAPEVRASSKTLDGKKGQSLISTEKSSISGAGKTESEVSDSTCSGTDSCVQHGPDGNIRSFEFVNATTSYKNQDPVVRKRVRAHVMKDFTMSKTRSQRYEAHREMRRMRENGHAGLVSKTDEQPPIKLSNSLADNVMDAFYTKLPILPLLYDLPSPSPITMSPKISSLLSRYFSNLPCLSSHQVDLLSRTNNDSLKAWFHIAFSDAASFHAMLSIVALYLTMLDHNQEIDEARQHMQLALRLLHQRLDNESEESLMSNSTISAVCCLAHGAVANLECGRLLLAIWKHGISIWDIHMAALKRLSQLHGGLSTIDPVLQLKVFRADLAGSFEKMSPPLFRFDVSSDSFLSPNHYSTGIDTSNTDFDDLLVAANTQPGLAGSLKSLHRICQSMTRTSIKEDALDDTAPSYTEHLYAIEYELLSTLSSASTIPSNKSGITLTAFTDPLNTALHLSAILYIKDLLGHWPFPISSSRRLVQSLRDQLQFFLNSISKKEVEASNALVLVLLLRLLFLGAGSCKPGAERTWFVAKIVKVAALMQINEWMEVRERILARVWWIEKVDGGRCKAVWEEVAILRREFGVRQ